MTDLASLLNPEQFEAATAPDGPLLILAAAGTGKTRTLVYRVVHLLERGIPASEILLLTFTNRAAKEMLTRADEATRGLASGLWGGTFHHVANRLLRRHCHIVGYAPDFRILDADDQRALMGRCIKDLGFDSKTFPKRELVLSLLSGAVNRGIKPEDWLNRPNAQFAAPAEDLLRVMNEYSKRKLDANAMDFDDLLVNANRILLEDEAARAACQLQFRHVLVDEYQDTNKLQSEFVDLLAARHRNLSVVGDDFQCIYSWRGSNYRNIMDFPERWPGAKIVKLERNYRSAPAILDLANESIRHNTDQFQKTLRPTREATARKPRVIEVRDGTAQAAEAVALIKRAMDDGYTPDQIAVLYRSHFHAVDVQLALARSRLSYRITSGTGFYEQKHVKDHLALLRLAENPGDSISATRVLSLLPKVGEATADRAWKKIGAHFDAQDEATREALLAALPPLARKAWAPISDALSAYKKTPFPTNVTELFRAFDENFYENWMKKEFENPKERLDDISELAANIASNANPGEFLEDVSLLTNLDRVGGPDPASSVLLSTIHQAKGLEWNVVIVIGLAEGLFPSSRALADQETDEEERRLFYVAATRARDRLFLLQPQWRKTPDGGGFPCEPSRFIREIPEALAPRERKGGVSIGLEGYGRYGRWGSTGYGRASSGEPIFRPGGKRTSGSSGLHVNIDWGM